MIVENKCPALIEAISYRVGDHSTSDFSEAYRKIEDEIEGFSDPIYRLRNYLLNSSMIDKDYEKKLREKAKEEARTALRNSIGMPKQPIKTLFEDVYDKMP